MKVYTEQDVDNAYDKGVKDGVLQHIKQDDTDNLQRDLNTLVRLYNTDMITYQKLERLKAIKEELEQRLNA